MIGDEFVLVPANSQSGGSSAFHLAAPLLTFFLKHLQNWRTNSGNQFLEVSFLRLCLNA
jgi:hypothetical protein